MSASATTAAANPAGQVSILNAMTVDVEDYFQVSAFRGAVRYDDWGRIESRVERNTQKALDLLSEFNIRGTFFILGWIAERFPALVRKIQTAGHELGCHSYAHRLIYELTPEEFRADTCRALQAIEDASGAQVRAYRAPSFSVTPQSTWAIEILLELGFTLDSSIFPVRHDLYGFVGAPCRPFRICVNGTRLTEFPPPTMRVGNWTFPVTGGGYSRVLPLGFQVRALRAIERRNETFVLYLHPWELDPEQPRLAVSIRSRLRHYTGLERTQRNLRLLLSRFQFGTFSEVLERCNFTHDFRFSGGPGLRTIIPVTVSG
jgi:polysaccharide deacetylase family protein (PEP-CTERM system associated)